MVLTANKIIAGILVLAALGAVYWWKYRGLEGATVEQLFEEHRTGDAARSGLAAQTLLLRVGPPDFGACMTALRHEKGKTRLLAIEALRKVRDARCISAVIKALSDQDAKVREEAARFFVVEPFRVKEPIPHLIKLLSDVQPSPVRGAALKSLKGLTWQSWSLSKDKWDLWWRANGVNFKVKPK